MKKQLNPFKAFDRVRFNTGEYTVLRTYGNRVVISIGSIHCPVFASQCELVAA